LSSWWLVRARSPELSPPTEVQASAAPVLIRPALACDSRHIDALGEYGLVIVDECHDAAATSFERVLLRIPARFLLGLTVTPAYFAASISRHRDHAFRGIAHTTQVITMTRIQ